ncbi:MAG: hypothetical protein L3K04_06870 [Thermoplasmata archaeon]|nr:hypothetical protein [Thermoplasmata archaeon]
MGAVGRSSARTSASFAPGHLTGVFRPALDARDPRARGSLGAGLVLSLGARAAARWSPGGARRIRIASDLGGSLPISEEVARRLVGGERGTLELFLAHELPVGRGFGMSAAGALATALATGDLLGRNRKESIATAHLADLFGGGGLGGVAAILGGGFEVRSRAGISPWGAVDHRPFPFPVWVASAGGPMPSFPLLTDPGFLTRVSRAARDGIEALERSPTPANFLSRSEEFTDRLALGPAPVRRLLRKLRTQGAWAAQAMLGRTVFAVAPNSAVRRRLVNAFDSAGVHAVELGVSRLGARRTRLR